ncbi:MAG: CO dehydrogenase/acetyl-CoA synthase subunit delta [Candidatus Helarchaeota archaeon]
MSRDPEEFMNDLEKLFDETGVAIFKDIQFFIDSLVLRPPKAAGYQAATMATQMLQPIAKRAEFIWKDSKLATITEDYPSEINVITFKRKGGKNVVIGGEKYPPFYSFLGKNPNRPVVTADVFDVPIHTKERPSILRLSKPVKEHFLNPDVSTNPGLWAKKHVEEFGADMITLHFIGTDPTLPEKEGGNQSVRQALEHLEQVMDAVDVPIIIGGSGNHRKDVELFTGVADMIAGNRFMLSSVELDTYEKIVPVAKKYDQIVLSWTQLDVNNQKKLNSEILDMGLSKDLIVMDPTVGPLGYGIEYSFSVYERMRLSGLKGEETLAFPMSGGTTNAWGAREAFMADKLRPEWGPRAFRGPLWEILTAFILSIVGLDLAMMLHPGSVAGFKDIIEKLSAPKPSKPVDGLKWITMK